MVPEHLRYTQQHEWITDIDEGVVRIGITHHAQDSLGDIVFVSLQPPGTRIAEGDSCGEVESTKSVAEIYAPVAGEVVVVNDVVETSPETINDDPYGDGWLLEIRPDDPEALEGLLTAEQYEQLISGGSSD